MSDLSEVDLSEFRQLLQDRSKTLQAIVKAGQEAAKVVPLDQSRVGRLSRMDAMQQQAMSQAASRRRLLELSKLAAALKRLDAGNFGYCLDCDELIARPRLELDPGATLCIGCAEKAGL